MKNLKDMYKTVVEDPFPKDMTITIGGQTIRYVKRTWRFDGKELGLRYGENPDQPAALYVPAGGELSVGGVPFRLSGSLISSMDESAMLQAGKHPGKTNLTDVDNGANILQYLSAKPACVILKHNNPCGAAWSDAGLLDAFTKAFASDRIAAFGGAIVVNRTLDAATAQAIAKAYFEVVAAPDFEDGALAALAAKKNLRVLKLPALADLAEKADLPFLDVKSLTDGGMVFQFSFRNRIRTAEDFLPAAAKDANGLDVTARAPTKAEAEDLLFAWAVEAGVTSNSVIFARDGATVAIGTGEQDRVGVVQLTIHKAMTKYADGLSFAETGKSLFELTAAAKGNPDLTLALEAVWAKTKEDRGGLPGSVLVSDGFFPFRDGVDLCIEAGVTAIAQPGGSIRDTEVIAAVNEASPQVAMVFTGQRSFKH